ncbi:MAG: hypothetical protein KGH63_00835 [Candidatus Micrarchaeota archaeon]|nr:hypothetical protein [Candidatus Micrarchaeota archaeon]
MRPADERQGIGAAAHSSTDAQPELGRTYRLPPHLSERLDDISWETIIDMSGSFSAKTRTKRPEVAHLHKQISMTRLLLMEKAHEQSRRQALDPAILVDLIRLLERCERLSTQYEMDLDEFNHFLYLLISKVKKEKLARHEGKVVRMAHFRPMDEEELERLKGRSERRRG